MKKFGSIIVAILIGTTLFEIISPAIEPRWLRFAVEVAVIIIFGFIGLAFYKSIHSKDSQSTTE